MREVVKRRRQHDGRHLLVVELGSGSVLGRCLATFAVVEGTTFEQAMVVQSVFEYGTLERNKFRDVLWLMLQKFVTGLQQRYFRFFNSGIKLNEIYRAVENICRKNF